MECGVSLCVYWLLLYEGEGPGVGYTVCIVVGDYYCMREGRGAIESTRICKMNMVCMCLRVRALKRQLYTWSAVPTCTYVYMSGSCLEE